MDKIFHLICGLAQIVLIIYMMKRIIYSIMEVIGELRRDIDVYLAIRRYARNTRRDRAKSV